MKINSKVATIGSMILLLVSLAGIVRWVNSCSRISKCEMVSPIEEYGCTNHSNVVSHSDESGSPPTKSVSTVESQDRKDDKRKDGLGDRHASLLKKIGVIRE